MESVKIHDKTFVPYLKHNELQEVIKELPHLELLQKQELRLYNLRKL
jgi:hypothetical protein